MMYPKIPLAQGVIQLLQLHNICDIIISPGSRNAPLTIGFTENDFFSCYSIVDERCAAFFALGMAQQTKKPTVLVCTSGSALLNYYPAIAEAFYSQIPLLILSADRPIDKIDIGDGQTIRQANVFENHCLLSFSLPEKWTSDSNTAINQAIIKATSLQGPVHINLPFEEPLYETTFESNVRVEKLESEKFNPVISQREWNEIEEIWTESSKKLILIGCNNPKIISHHILTKWINDPSVVVMTESTSNVSHPDFINCIDQLITPFTPQQFEEFKPDLLITIGGMIVSKRIKSFLRNHKPNEHWHIDTLRAYDTYGCLTKHIQVSPQSFFTDIYDQTDPTISNYKKKLLDLKSKRLQKHDAYLSKSKFSDLQVFETIFKNIPDSIHLQLSNSSTIRYAQLFTMPTDTDVFCNRGTSGIDGSTSTAIGAACKATKPTYFITGDISFFYDSNALWNSYIPNNFKIIIINNAGGGIFRILPGHKETITFNTFFETQHQLNASYLAEMYNFTYQKATDLESLNLGLKTLNKNVSPCILEVLTPTNINNSELLNYFSQMS